MHENLKIQTGKSKDKINILNDVKRDVIVNKVDTGKINNIYKIKSKRKINRVKKEKLKLQKIRLVKKKYIGAKPISKYPPIIETVKVNNIDSNRIVEPGGKLRTAIKNKYNNVGIIKTKVSNDFGNRSNKAVSRISTFVGIGVKNIANDTRSQILKTKIDKSEITDTGTEAIKKCITEIGYADNVRRAIVKTARKKIKTRNTKTKIQSVKSNVETARKVAKKTSKGLKKLATLKLFLIIILIFLFILFMVLFMNSMITLICATISSMFIWMFPNGDNSRESIENNLNNYLYKIMEYEDRVQDDIDAIVNSLSAEYRHDGSQIDNLNRFRNSDLNICDYKAVIAILAVQKYEKFINRNTEEFYFKNAEIQDVMDKFYDFSYYYEYNYCPNWDCSIDEDCLLSLSAESFHIEKSTYNMLHDYFSVTLQGPTYEHALRMSTLLEIYMTNDGLISGSSNAYLDKGTWTVTFNIGRDAYNQIDWDRFYLTVTTTYCNNPNHCYLYGNVINYRLDTVLEKCNFTKEQRDLFDVYYLQIQSLLGV